ncbi:DUF6801 domain-containing protein [Amycolatopsis sp. NPDC058986]|uniref:DUF6801 domain-containing protein n=1 Tax=unclassified Amycolatopsis TaxID=2618356 RepID=UPI00366F31E0
MTSQARRRRTTASALTAVGLASVITGGLTGVGSAATGPESPSAQELRAVTRAVTSTCAFAAPIGPRGVSAEITAKLPVSAPKSKPITLGELSMKLVLPRDAAQSLVTPGTPGHGSVQGGLSVVLTAVQDTKHDTITVPMDVAPTPVPDTGDLTLTATGKPPEFALESAGPVVLGLAAPTLALQSPLPDGTPATAPAKQVTCTLDPEQNTTLGSIMVTPPATPQTASPAPATPGGAPGERRGEPGTVTAQDEEPPPYIQALGLVRVTSTATVERLGVKVATGPTGLVKGRLIMRFPPDSPPVVTAQGFVSFKPVSVPFLGFGFVPVSGTVEFLPLDYKNGKDIEIVGSLDNGILTTHLEVMARMSDAKVNGTPLDLGPDCVTARPVALDIRGDYDPFGIGVIGTDPNSPDPKFRGFTLPPFKGCGVAEPLDALLTGMTSGPGNQAKVITQNLLPCHEPDHRNCPKPPS